MDSSRLSWDGDLLWKWVLRLAGLAGIAWETIVENTDRPELLILFGGMVGLDKVLEWDARRRKSNGRQTRGGRYGSGRTPHGENHNENT